MAAPETKSEDVLPQSSQPVNTAPSAVSGSYAYYVLGVFFVVTIFNYIDRQILAILSQPIKDDLKISDTALGFLTGFAFAAFYTFAGLPLARLADRWVRWQDFGVRLNSEDKISIKNSDDQRRTPTHARCRAIPSVLADGNYNNG